MTDPSPQAQAVWDAYEKADCDPYLVDPRRAGLAAALLAAADQPYQVPEYVQGDSYWPFRNGVDAERSRLLAIAAELEGAHG